MRARDMIRIHGVEGWKWVDGHKTLEQGLSQGLYVA